jgi:F0F1-type ATP synthase assembly protein I
MKKNLAAEEKKIEQEIKEMDEVEYGLKELIQGILIGIFIGFMLAWFLLK